MAYALLFAERRLLRLEKPALHNRKLLGVQLKALAHPPAPQQHILTIRTVYNKFGVSRPRIIAVRCVVIACFDTIHCESTPRVMRRLDRMRLWREFWESQTSPNTVY